MALTDPSFLSSTWAPMIFPNGIRFLFPSHKKCHNVGQNRRVAGWPVMEWHHVSTSRWKMLPVLLDCMMDPISLATPFNKSWSWLNNHVLNVVYHGWISRNIIPHKLFNAKLSTSGLGYHYAILACRCHCSTGPPLVSWNDNKDTGYFDAEL